MTREVLLKSELLAYSPYPKLAFWVFSRLVSHKPFDKGYFCRILISVRVY